MYCPPGESWYAVLEPSGWHREFLTATLLGGVCGELALGPRDEVHVTTPVAAGIGHPLYGVRENGAWTFEPTDIGSVQAVDSFGRPHSAYLVRTAPGRVTMQHVWRDGAWQAEEIESFTAQDTISSRWVSFALDGANNPRVLYYEDARGDVRYASRDPSGWHVEVVEHIGALNIAGREGSLALDANGDPHAAYTVRTAANAGEVRYVIRGAGGWTSEVASPPPPALGGGAFSPSLAIAASGPALTYVFAEQIDPARIVYSQDLVFATRGPAGWSSEIVLDGFWDNTIPRGQVPQFPSLRIDACGNPHAAFYQAWWEGLDGSRSGAYYATKGEPCPPTHGPHELKRDAIERIKALKEQALARGDNSFVRKLDRAERHLWTSLGYEHPFRPDSTVADLGVDVSLRKVTADVVQLDLGPSWAVRLASSASVRLTWANGVVTVIDLPNGWAEKGLHVRERAWVDGWRQDIAIDSNGAKGPPVTFRVAARDASLGFSVSLDADRVAGLSFTYAMRHLWVDATHLDPEHGGKVFDEEKQAVKELVCVGEGDDDREHAGCREDDHGHDDKDDDSAATVRCCLDPGKWNDSERAALDKECVAIANLLVKADEMLALVALQDAKDTSIRNPHHAKEVQREIEKAERELKKASSDWDEHEYEDAIDHFEHAWDHARHAIEQATR